MKEKSSVRSLTEKNIIVITVISEEVDEGSNGLLVKLKRARDNPTTPRDGLRGRTTCKSLHLEEGAAQGSADIVAIIRTNPSSLPPELHSLCEPSMMAQAEFLSQP